MDKGIKKLQKHIDKIYDYNIIIVDKAVKRILKLKRHKLSSISSNMSHVVEILIHKDTANFPILKQKLLEHFNEIHDLYPFLSIGFDPIQSNQSNNDRRKLKSENFNRLLLTINWNDYMRVVMKERGFTNNGPVTSLGINYQLEDIKISNMRLVQHAIKDALSKSHEFCSSPYTNFNMKLRPNTMSYEITREHFISIARKINQQYKGIVEIINVGMSDDVILRVHWNIYLDQISSSKVEQNVNLDSIDIPSVINTTQPQTEQNDNKVEQHTKPTFAKYPLIPNDEPEPANQPEKKKDKVIR